MNGQGKDEQNSHATSFIRTGFEASLGGPMPALFSALTRNS